MSGARANELALVRLALDVVAGRWVVHVIEQLARTSPMRYRAIAEAIPEVPDGSLSRTLRQLERDGLVRRSVNSSTMPVQVEYELTSTGETVVRLCEVLAEWAAEHGHDIQAAREGYRGPQN